MKLLFDQNVSPTLVDRLADLFPDSVHVETVGLDRADDEEIWDFARNNDLTIVSKDEDYDQLSVLRGSPPQVLWLQIGNCTTSQIEALLRTRFAEIAAFGRDPSLGTMALG